MSIDSPRIVRFGPFELDRELRELRRDGRAIAIQPLPLKALLLLTERLDSIVDRARFHQELWPDADSTDVERSLNHTIRKLRQTLGDDSKSPLYIQTVPRRGYRFIGAVVGDKPTAGPSKAPADPPRGVVAGETLVVRVLEFEAMADDQSWSYLSSGLRQELISKLVSLDAPGLVVIDEPGGEGITTPFLGLKGSVQRTGTTVRIHAFLSAYGDGGSTFVAESTQQMELGNVFELQHTASRHIVETLVAPRLR